MRALHLPVALALGVATAFLVACGTSGGIPASDASRLTAALDRVAADTRAGRCDAAEAAVVKARGVALNLPSSVDPALRARVRSGIANLRDRVPVECQQSQTGGTANGEQPTTETTTPQTTGSTETSTTDSSTTETTDTSTTDTSTTDTSTTDTGTTPTGTTGTGTTTGTTTTTPPTTTGTGGTPPGDGG